MIEDLSHNIGSMSIYEKLARIQEEVMNTSFSKSGENKFQKYKSGDLTKDESKIVFEWFKKQDKEAKT